MIGFLIKKIKVKELSNGYAVYKETKSYPIDDFDAQPVIENESFIFTNAQDVEKYLNDNH